MMRRRGWFGGGLWKPKNLHSLEHLKYLYNLLAKNQVVTEQNKSLLVETLRSIAEILIWGDQNDSTVFDFFLEKNMLSFFLKIMRQKCGSYVCVQLLQTLNILFENIRNETSLYYLLSNNHVNYIIVHKFDFSDEEVMAYYISFLKTLSFKLNAHTIHFFYNEHTHDFPLYTEAIKFFNHNESMVRIAVRTLTLNVYRVEDRSMLKFIRDKTAAPYFSNLVWFIGNHVLELDSCVRNDAEYVLCHQSRNRLADLVAEHLDHLHYLNDILCLKIESLNDVLTDHLLNRLLIPLYVYSLTKRRRHSQAEDDKPHVSSVVSLFLLSQVFLIISHVPLVRQLADIILNRDMAIFSEHIRRKHATPSGTRSYHPGFIPPAESLEKSLENRMRRSASSLYGIKAKGDLVTSIPSSHSVEETISATAVEPLPEVSEAAIEDDCFQTPTEELPADLNITDEEKQKQAAAGQRFAPEPQASSQRLNDEFSLVNRPYLEAVFNVLEVSENDYAALFGLCLLYALGNNPGIDQELLDSVLMPTNRSETKHWYNVALVDRLIKIISSSCQYSSKVRLATLEMSILLLKQLVLKNAVSFLQDRHLAAVEGAREESTLLLRNFYKSEEIFLDMFEDEHRELKKRLLNVEYLMMDSNLLLPPTGTPLTGIDFYKRLPCGEVERARRVYAKTIRVFFLLRDLSLTLRSEPESQLPLTNPQACIQIGDVLDLNNSDLIACTVVSKDSQKIRRFLVIDIIQLVLVEPDTKRLGWGIAKFVGFLQDVEVIGDKDDSRCLHVTIHRPLSSATAIRVPLLSARFVFDDHIRCMAAKQRLTKGRLKARQRKMHLIARLLELPGNIQPCPSPPARAIRSLRHADGSPKRGMMPRSQSHEHGMRIRTPAGFASGHYKPMFNASGHKVPGFAAVMRKDDSRASRAGKDKSVERRQSLSPSGRAHRSREGSPSTSFSEEIPLEDMAQERSSNGSHQRKSAPELPASHICVSPQHGVNSEAVGEPPSYRSTSRTKLRSLSEPSSAKPIRIHHSPQTKDTNSFVAGRLVPPVDVDNLEDEDDASSLQVETSFFGHTNATPESDADLGANANDGGENSNEGLDLCGNTKRLTAQVAEPVHVPKVKGAVMNI